MEISALKITDDTEITVADNGIGIPNEQIDKIWGRFYRIDEYGSSGLGLATAKSIIELQGGKISVRSTVGQRTEFRIVLNDRFSSVTSVHRLLLWFLGAVAKCNGDAT